MDQFLIDLAMQATWNRLLPFPDQFRTSTSPGTPHTEAEYLAFIQQLNSKNPNAIEYVVNIDRGIVQHNDKSINPHITEFEFQYDPIDNYRKNLKYPNRWYLFHGSPIGNWHSIIRNGIKNMSGTPFMSTGQALGPGVYASNLLATAYGYGGHTDTRCVAVIEILTDPAPYMKSSAGVYAGVYVIPDDKLLFPRYLLKVKGLPKNIKGEELLDYYKKLREGLIKSKTKANRLEADRLVIQQYYLDTLNLHCWSICIDGVLCRCYVFNYPFTAPVIQLCYKLKDGSIAEPFFDRYGCYKYEFSEWTAQNDIQHIIQHAKKNVSFATIEQTLDEYTSLEML